MKTYLLRETKPVEPQSNAGLANPSRKQIRLAKAARPDTMAMIQSPRTTKAESETKKQKARAAVLGRAGSTTDGKDARRNQLKGLNARLLAPRSFDPLVVRPHVAS